jgi:hypothetical protein
MKLATKANRDPTASGLGVSHSARWIFAYHSTALSGSDAYSATSLRGRAIVISVSTSMAMPPSLCAPARRPALDPIA